jgi:IgA Peptidase M64
LRGPSAPSLANPPRSPVIPSGTPVRKVLDNGPDTDRLVLAVLGDGYTAGEQEKFAADVDRLLLRGVLAHDVFGEHREAFNVYRVDLVSRDSGVSRPGRRKNTALSLLYTGDFTQSWIEPGPGSEPSLRTALHPLPHHDLALVVANEHRYGACFRYPHVYATAATYWHGIAHELGHALAGLYDEYSRPGSGAYAGPAINHLNCTTSTDRAAVVWRDLIEDRVAVPTVFEPWMDPSATVGVFEGGNLFDSGIYRPVHRCRMRATEEVFCPVCRRELQAVITEVGGGAASF